MKKLDLRAYLVKVKRTSGEIEEVPYQMKESLIEILFNPSLKLNGVKVLKQNALAMKIEASGDELLLEDEEHERVLHALSLVEGIGRNEVEFARRIIEAESVTV